MLDIIDTLILIAIAMTVTALYYERKLTHLETRLLELVEELDERNDLSNEPPFNVSPVLYPVNEHGDRW